MLSLPAAFGDARELEQIAEPDVLAVQAEFDGLHAIPFTRTKRSPFDSGRSRYAQGERCSVTRRTHSQKTAYRQDEQIVASVPWEVSPVTDHRSRRGRAKVIDRKLPQQIRPPRHRLVV